MTDHRSRTLLRKIAAVTMAVWFVFVSLGVPRSVRAQGGPVTEGPPLGPLWLQREAAEFVDRAMKDSFKFQLQMAMINAMQFFFERFAYETAVWLASGGKAQSPLFNRESALGFLRDSALGAGLQFVDDLDKYAAGQLGFDGPFGVAQFICSPTIPSIKLKLKLGLADRLRPRQPICTWNQLSDNWDTFTQGGFGATLSRSLSQTGIAFEPGQSELSAGLELHIGIGEKQAQVASTKLNEYLANKGYRSLDEKISGIVKTPSSIVQGKAEKAYVEQPNKSQEVNQEFALQSISTFEHFWPMLGAAGEALAINFGVTLFSQVLQQQVLNKGIFIGDANAGLGGDEESSSPPAAREQQARTAFAELQRPRFVSSGDYDQLTELASCDPQRRLLTTCAIDEGFVEAVRYAQSNKPITVAEAVTAGLLHADWPLIKVGTAKDQDPNCSKGPPTGGYCASNLQKLRRARIIPIGWELAANHEANSAADPVRLGQVVDAFHRNGIDGVCGNADAEESSYCGLIDPNWVLTYPIQQCQLRGPGELLLGSGTAIRAESCVDAPSCLERDGEGKCVGGYGYCVREKNIWHLAGQSCPGQYASCRAFSSREGASLAVLTSTIDRSVCTAENAGCRWYATTRDAAGNWESGSRRYLNRLAEACTEANEGCTELISVKSARRNLIDNPSFERDASGQPVGWTLGSETTYSTDGSDAIDGRAAARVKYDPDPNAGPGFAAYTAQYGAPIPPSGGSIPVHGDRTYVLSASAKRPSGVTNNQLRVHLKFFDSANVAVPIAGMRTSCNTSVGSDPNAGDGGHTNGMGLYVNPADTSAGTGSCWFQVPTAAAEVALFAMSTTVDPIIVDAIQLEEGETPSAFHDGYAADAPRTYLKVASPDLRCYDVGGDGQLNIANDHASCPSFAAGCTEADVGCERFAPQDGSPTVNGQFSDIDRCPAACVGYAAFREVASAFDEKDTFDFFIPSTARQCSAAEVGCSEFTNMDALERGGEQREYFSQLRRCEKPGEATSATYYTWEGSDTQGYQLRSFVLKRDSGAADSAPPAVFGYEEDENVNCGPLAGGGTDHYGKRPTDAGYDSTITPDCRAFYSQNGDINYRRLSRTILITDDCVRYRVTHTLDSDTCDLAGGALSPTAGCVLKGHRQESTQCQAASAGCRAYRGNAGGAIQTIVATDFEAEVAGQLQQGWELVSGGAPTISADSLTVGGHSIQLTDTQVARYPLRVLQTGLTRAACETPGGTFTAAAATTLMTASDCATVGGTHNAVAGTCDHSVDFCTLPRLHAGGTYELMVVGKGAAQIEVGLRQGTGGATDLIDSSVAVSRRRATFTPTWQRVVIGPLVLATSPPLTADTSLRITATGGSAFFDTILFREVPQLTTVIKGSWRTPQACDRASIADNAAPLAQGMLGCRAYQTRTGGTETLRSFSRLCRAEVVGCTAFHDTRNSADLGSQTFNDPPSEPAALNLDDVTVPADVIRYLVDDRAKYCQAAAKGCARFGQPTLDRTANVTDARANPPATDWADAFLLDQPDRYTGPGAILCEHPALFCEEYRGQDGTVIYFKDPGNRTCEYREGVIVNGIPYAGWFRSGSDPPQACDPGLLIGGSQYGIWKNADPNYGGWSGLCQAGFDHCTEFVDPTDRTPAHPNGQPYHAIRTTVDFASCQGGVSQKEGCVVLSDASDPSTRFSAEASLGESDLRQGARVPAINCDANPAGCKRCVVERKCRADDGHVQGTQAGEPSLPPGAPAICLSDSDCGDGVPAGFRCRGGEIGPTCTTLSPVDAASDTQCDNEFNPRAICRQFANDGNAIIKVQRDRSCGQWLACRSATEAQDPSLNRSIEVCESIDLCESYQTAEGGSVALRCARWVRGEETQGKILTRQLYQDRERGWTGLEYSGYSITGMYQPHELVPIDVSIFRDKIDQRLVYIDPHCWGTVSTPATDPNAPVAPIRPCERTVDGEVIADPAGQCDGLPTTPDDPATPYVDGRLPTKCGLDGRGLCVSHKCVYGANGTTLTGIGTVTGPQAVVALPVQCRVYPEPDSPFDAAVAEFAEVPISRTNLDDDPDVDRTDTIRVRTASLPGYQGANTCAYQQDRDLAQCGCLYNKIKYGGETKYFSMRDRDIPPGFCDGGFDASGKSKAAVYRCDGDLDCEDERNFGSDLARAVARCGGAGADGCKESAGAQIAAQRLHGKCKLDERRERFFGLTGICLERDQSIAIDGDPGKHPCVSWYPVQQLAGGVDLFNQYDLAGFHEEAQYCTQAKRYEFRKNIEGMRIEACDIALILGSIGGAGACTAFSGGAAIVACLTAAYATAGAGGAALGDNLANLCQGDSNYEVFGWETDWVDGFTDWPTLCPPWFDVTLHCQPRGGTGWYPDPGGDVGDYPQGDDNDSPAGPEEEAYRCTEVLDVADVPVPGTGQTGNIAWTDRVRPRSNLEEELVVAASQVNPARPQHPNRYVSSCGVFGQLARGIDPATVNGESSRKYLEVFPDAHPLSGDAAVCASGALQTNSPSTDSSPPEVAAARRHYEDIVEGATALTGGRTVQALQGFFSNARTLWRWRSTTEARECNAASGSAKRGDNCIADGQCEESGLCRGICRMVVGRCKTQIGTTLGGTAVYAAAGDICTSNTQCGGGGECWKTRGVCNGTEDRCSSNADCDPGVACLLPTGNCAGGSGATCTTDANCSGTTGPCLFPILPIGSDADGGVKDCTSTSQCGAGHNPSGGDQNLDPNGVCQPGCWNSSARGERCDGTFDEEGNDDANAQCAFSGQCVPIPAGVAREDTGEFEERSPPVSTWTPIQRGGASGASSAPRIASIGTCAQLGGCTVGKLDRFTVNELDEDEVRAAGGLVTVRFFGWAHRNQMPLIEVKVDWGDDSPVSGGIGKYQNHKPYCATGEDLSTSVFRCSAAPELTCQTNADCPTGAGTCQGQFCRMGCDAETDCPASATCDTNTQTCVRDAGQKLCLLSVGTGAAVACTQSSDCTGAGNECVDVGGTPLHTAQTCGAPATTSDPPATCTMTVGGTPYTQSQNRCIGETSFGNMPDACSATPFTFRHTYRCDGVNDPRWNGTEGGCVFTPKVKLRDNWYWCTGTPAGGGNPQGPLLCDDPNDPFIEFGGQVIVSG